MVRYAALAVLALSSFLAPVVLAGPVGLGADHRGPSARMSDGISSASDEAIVINPDIQPECAPCRGRLPCWRKGCQIKPKILTGPRDKRGPPGAFKDAKANGASQPRPPFAPMRDGTWPDKDRTEDLTYYEPHSGYANGYEYGYTNKSPDGKDKGCYWGDSDAACPKQFNCPGCHKDFDEVSSHVKEGPPSQCSECPGCSICAAHRAGEVADSDDQASTVAARSESQQAMNAGTPRDTAAIVNGPQFAVVCVVTQLSQMCIAAGNAVCSPTGTLDGKDPRCARACNCVRV